MADEVPLLDLIADDEPVETNPPERANPARVIAIVVAVTVVASLVVSAFPRRGSETGPATAGLVLVEERSTGARVVDLATGRGVSAGAWKPDPVTDAIVVTICDPTGRCGPSLVGPGGQGLRPLPPLPAGISIESAALLPDGALVVAGREPRDGPLARHAFALVDGEWVNLGGLSATTLVEGRGAVVSRDQLPESLREALGGG